MLVERKCPHRHGEIKVLLSQLNIYGILGCGTLRLDPWMREGDPEHSESKDCQGTAKLRRYSGFVLPLHKELRRDLGTVDDALKKKNAQIYADRS